MSKPRGHSNVVNEPTPLSTSQVMVPISGGASIATYRRLPDLILSRQEWEDIGKAMGWLKPRSGKRGGARQ